MTSTVGRTCLLCLLTFFIVTLLLPSVVGKPCIDHFTVEGVEEDGIAEKNNIITVTYYVNRDKHAAKDYLYTIHWDEQITPVMTRRDHRFSTYFRINQGAKNVWRVLVHRPLRNKVSPVKGAEFSGTFGPFKDSLNCTVTLRHFIVDHESQGKASGRNSSDFRRKMKWAADDPGSSLNSTLRIPLLSEEVSTSSTTYETTESMTAEKRDVWVNYRVAVGVLGGLLGLALIVGISVGLYYNYKNSSRLGLFRRKQPKTISLLSQAYPNIAMSNTDMRLNSREAYEPSSTSYPDYGFANPSATEDAPPAYKPEII